MVNFCFYLCCLKYKKPGHKLVNFNTYGLNPDMRGDLLCQISMCVKTVKCYALNVAHKH